MSLRTLLSVMSSDIALVDDSVNVDTTMIEWAHVSEMVDPTPWLQGGELLLLTGLMLPSADKEALAAYVARLDRAGVAALGISTGTSLAHHSVPAALASAASKVGLPLLSIGESMPLERIVQTIAQHSYQEQISNARRNAVIQRALTQFLSQGGPASDLLDVVEDEFGVSSLVTTPAGQVHFEPSHEATDARSTLREYAGVVAAGIVDGLHVTDQGAEHVELHAIDVDRCFVGGFLALSGPSPFPRSLRETLPLLLSALGRVLLPPATGDAHHLAWREDCARWVFSSPASDSAINERLVAAGYQDTLVRAVSIHGNFTPDIGRKLARFYFESQCEVLLAHARSARVECLLLNPAAVLRVNQGVGGVSVAVGILTGQSSISRTVRTSAESAAALSTDHSADPALAQLLATVTLEDRRAFAIAVLGKLIDSPGELLTTLEVYLATLGGVEATATRLSVHRHTVRHRLARITDVTGRNPEKSTERMLFAVALELFPGRVKPS